MLNLLLIEDSDDDVRLIERHLRALGRPFHVTAVHDEAALRAALQNRTWDAVLADYVIPGFSGFQALRVVREYDGNVPLILLSGSAGEELAVEAMHRGAHDYITKGNLQRLVPALERELQDAQVRREASTSASELLQIQERFRALIEHGTDVISLLSEEGLIIYESPSIERALGYSPSELTGRSAFEHVHPDDLPPMVELFRREIGNPGSTARVEYRYRHADGTWHWVESIARNLLDHPSIGAVVVNTRDITERRMLQEQLAQADRLAGLGRLAATIAHEFNNVLMGIQPFCEVIRRVAPDNQKIVTATKSIANAVERGRSITHDILRFTQPLVPALTTFGARTWLETTIAELQQMVGERFPIELSGVPDDLVLRADTTHLRQVLTNLVINAREAMLEGGTISFDVELLNTGRIFPWGVVPDDGPFVHLSVRDSGPGVAPELRARIFEPLFTTKRKGTGLGLAVAEQIVKRHGGHLFVDSSPGEGATFHIILPAPGESAREVAAPAAGVHVSHSGARILLVEDDASVAMGIASLLESMDYRVTVAGSGHAALREVQSRTPDVIVLDVNLPDLSGVDVYRELQARTPNVPVIFSTGHYRTPALAALLGEKPETVACLTKPYEVTALRQQIDLMMNGRK